MKCLICNEDKSEPFIDKFNTVKCKKCGFVYSAEEKKLDDTRFWKGEESLENIKRDLHKVKIKEIKRYKKGGSILDIGCAFGLFLREARKQGFDVYGIELDENAIDACREECIPLITYDKLDRINPDIVTMYHVLEHMPDADAKLKQVHSIMKDDGLLVVEVPNIESFDAKRKKEDWWYINHTHIYYFSPATIKKLLERNGFKVLSIKHVGGFMVDRQHRMASARSMLNAHYSYLKIFKDIFYLVSQKLRLSDCIRVYAIKVRDHREIAKNYWFVEHKNIMKLLKLLRKGESIKLNNFSGETKELCTAGSTTGHPKYTAINKEQLELRFAAEWWTMEWTGWMYGERWAHLWYPQTREHNDTDENIKKLEKRRLLENCLFLSYFDLDDKIMQGHYEKLKKFQPKVLVGYSEALFIFADFLKKNGLRLKIPAVISSGGQLSPKFRKLIEETMDTKVWNRYGCSQFGVVAMEDWRDKGQMKIITQRGLSVKQKNNRLLITDMNNKVTKFKDYDLGDSGEVEGNTIKNLQGKLKSGMSYLRIYQSRGR